MQNRNRKRDTEYPHNQQQNIILYNIHYIAQWIPIWILKC